MENLLKGAGAQNAKIKLHIYSLVISFVIQDD